MGPFAQTSLPESSGSSGSARSSFGSETAVRVRRATLADLPPIAAIEKASFPDPWPADFLAAYFDDRHALVLVAEVPCVVAFLIARDEFSRQRERVLHIHDLAVTPAHRRRGAATALLAELTAIAQALGGRRIRIEVRVDNESARRFYEHHGFQVVRRLARYYDDGGAALRMERRIAAGSWLPV